jgi:imidazoleglycerol-phosphate dehydratase
MAARSAEVSRRTKETDISVSVHVDGDGKSDISTSCRAIR